MHCFTLFFPFPSYWSCLVFLLYWVFSVSGALVLQSCSLLISLPFLPRGNRYCSSHCTILVPLRPLQFLELKQCRLLSPVLYFHLLVVTVLQLVLCSRRTAEVCLLTYPQSAVLQLSLIWTSQIHQMKEYGWPETTKIQPTTRITQMPRQKHKMKHEKPGQHDSCWKWLIPK